MASVGLVLTFAICTIAGLIQVAAAGRRDAATPAAPMERDDRGQAPLRSAYATSPWRHSRASHRRTSAAHRRFATCLRAELFGRRDEASGVPELGERHAGSTSDRLCGQ